MIYTGLNRTGEIETVKANGGADIAEVYGGIGDSNPIYYKQREMVGTSPMQFKALGLPLKDYLISGNTLQDGTPTPEALVDVVGCGVRTENLFDETYPNIKLDTPEYRSIFVGDGEFTLSTMAEQYGRSANLFFLTGRVNSGAATATNGVWKENPRTITSLNGYVTIAYRYYDDEKSDPRFNTAMLNLGATPLPYEPYGYKLPLTVNGTEYPIYLGEVQTTRRIKKLVLTGEENWEYQDAYTRFMLYLRDAMFFGVRLTPIICTHYISINDGRSITDVPDNATYVGGSSAAVQFFIKSHNYTTIADLKSYLAAQYANGTPVTIWYVLANPETDIVNEPLHKIGGYADTISFAQAGVTIPTVSGTNTLTVDTTVKPSEIDLTGRIKPTGYGQLLDVNDVDIRDSNSTPIFIRG